MGDEHSERKKRLLIWSRIGTAFVGSCIGEYIFNQQAFHDQGFWAFRRTDILVPAFAVAMASWVSRVAQREETTTLGIADATAKKLQ